MAGIFTSSITKRLNFVYNHICFSSSSLDDLDDQNNTALKEEQKANQNPSNLPQVMHWNAGIQKISEVVHLNVILWDYICVTYTLFLRLNPSYKNDAKKEMLQDVPKRIRLVYCLIGQATMKQMTPDLLFP